VFATLTTPTGKRKGGQQARRYDCGRHGRLTVRQIAQLADISPKCVHDRLNAGWSPERACSPKYGTRRTPRAPVPPKHHNLQAAFVIAERFRHRLPTVEEIQAIRYMSKQHALMWRRAIAEARKSA
jgi:hypothetical protein